MHRTLLDFAIAGFPKCGTTTLYKLLGQHPELNMSELKEPHYFSTDIEHMHYVKSENEYDKLFSLGKDDQLRGEASTWYLYSKVALNNLIENNSKIKLIIIVRDPISMFLSLHSHNLREGYEKLENPIVAWKKSKESDTSELVPTNYYFLCRYAPFIKMVKTQIEDHQILILKNRELNNNLDASLFRIIEFLDISEFVYDISRQRENESRSHKNAYIKFLDNKTKKLRLTQILRMIIPTRIKKKLHQYIFLKKTKKKSDVSLMEKLFLEDFSEEYAYLNE